MYHSFLELPHMKFFTIMGRNAEIKETKIHRNERRQVWKGDI